MPRYDDGRFRFTNGLCTNTPAASWNSADTDQQREWERARASARSTHMWALQLNRRSALKHTHTRRHTERECADRPVRLCARFLWMNSSGCAYDLSTNSYFTLFYLSKVGAELLAAPVPRHTHILEHPHIAAIGSLRSIVNVVFLSLSLTHSLSLSGSFFSFAAFVCVSLRILPCWISRLSAFAIRFASVWLYESNRHRTFLLYVIMLF